MRKARGKNNLVESERFFFILEDGAPQSTKSDCDDGNRSNMVGFSIKHTQIDYCVGWMLTVGDRYLPGLTIKPCKSVTCESSGRDPGWSAATRERGR